MKLIRTETFNKLYSKLDTSVQKLVDKQIEILIETKGQGKPLYKDILFERKVEGFRMYYFKINQNTIILILASIMKKTSKKAQQEEIEKLKDELDKLFSDFQ